jgi:hypothetical protein
MNDSEPYEMARALDSDDDHPIGELTESDVEMLRRIFPVRHDPRVHEFSDHAHSDQACVKALCLVLVISDNAHVLKIICSKG